MKQYIDKDLLIKEIEKYISNYKGILNKIAKSSDEWVTTTLMLESKIDVLQHILSFINNLEVKEVDLERVFNDEYSKFSNDVDAMDYGFPIDLADYKDFAKHFFELGLKAI